MLALIKACIAGLETGIETHCQNGIWSAFLLLEIIYTHFTGKEETGTNGKTKAEIEIGKTLKKNEPQKDTRRALRSSMSLPDSVSISSVSVGSDFSDGEKNQTPSLDEGVSTTPPEITVDLTDGNTQSTHPVELQEMLSLADMQSIPGGIRKSATLPLRRTPSRRSPKVFLGPAVHSVAADDSFSLSGSEEIISSGDFHEKSPEPSDWAWRDAQSSLSAGSDDGQTNKRIRRRSRRQGYSPNRSEQYMYKELVGKGRSRLWDYGEFWTALFLDTVAAERSAVGLVEMPVQLIDRYVYCIS